MDNKISFKAGKFFQIDNFFVTTADFNSDGIVDQVKIADNIVSIALGQNDGTFANSLNYAVGRFPQEVTIADFDNNGSLDIAVANSFFDEDVSLLLGNGDGSFQGAQTFPLLQSEQRIDFEFIVTADFNNDGIIDIATLRIVKPEFVNTSIIHVYDIPIFIRTHNLERPISCLIFRSCWEV